MYLTICLIITVVHLSYALLISQIGHKLASHCLRRKLDTITGGLFITLGGGILFTSRT